MTSMHAKIADMRHQSLQKVLESVLVYIGALYTTLLLPQLLLRYFYADQQLMAEPKALEMIPVIAFGFATLYMLFAVIGNISRGNKIKKMLAEMEAMGDGCGCDDHDLDDMELAELEAMVETAMVEDTATPARKAKKSTTKKSKK